MSSRHLPVSDPPPPQHRDPDEDAELTTTIATMDHPHGGREGSPDAKIKSGSPESQKDIPPPPPQPIVSEETNHHVTSSTTTTTEAPPYWLSQHARTTSSVSYHSLSNTSHPTAILLEDHSEEGTHQTQSCWAQSVSIDEYVIISGPSGIGAYVVWACTVCTLQGGELSLRKRYSEFDHLREELCRAFPFAEKMIPELPRKSHISRFRPKFLEQRKAGLQQFLNCILLNPEFASSPILKDFIFS